MATPVWQPGTLYSPGDLVQPASTPPPLFTALVNPGFETGSTASGWVGSDGNFQVLTNRVFAGTYSARYNGINTQASPAYLEQSAYAPVNAGQTINASCQVDQGELGSSPSQAGGWVAIAWYTAASTLISVSEGNRITSGKGGAWQQSVVAGVAPATATKCKLRVYAYKTVAAGGNNDKPGLDAAVWDQSYIPLADKVVYKATQTSAATSAAVEPVWPGEGNTVVDGGVTWLGVEASSVTWQATPILVSGASEPAFPDVAGASVIDNTIVWIATTGYVEEAPNSKVVAIAASKIFAADDDIVKFSATVNPLDWTTVDDAGYLPTGLQTYGANPSKVLQLYRGNLVPFNSAGLQMWQVDADPQLMALLDAIPVGSVYPRAAQPVSNDLMFLTSQGVRNLSIAGGSTNLQAGSYGEPIDPLIIAALAAAVVSGDIPNSIYYPQRGQYWLWFGAQVFVLTLNSAQPSWSRYLYPEGITDATLLNDDLYLRTATGKLWRVDDMVYVDDYSGPGTGGTVAFTAQEIAGAGAAFPFGLLTFACDNFVGTPSSCLISGDYTSGELAGYDTLGIATYLGSGPEIAVTLRVPAGTERLAPQTDYFTSFAIPGITASRNAADALTFTTDSSSQPGYTIYKWTWGGGGIGLMAVAVGYVATFLPNVSAGTEFLGTVWWPWLDFGSLGGGKMLYGFDIVCTGTVDVQIGYDQRNPAAMTPAYTVDGDTLVGMPIPMPVVGPSFSLKLTFAANQAWEIQAANLYMQDNRGGGATG